MACIDPRAYSETPLVAPEPLPHISRRALRRVRDSQPIPKDCRYCGMGVELVSNSEIYGSEFGDWPYAYLCRHCRAYVGVHPNTDIPVGTLADAELRQARKDHKRFFNLVLKGTGMSRREAYAWLARKMGIPVEECHWGWFEIEDCEKAGAICREKMEEFSHGCC